MFGWNVTMVFNIYYQNVRGLRTKTLEFKRNIQLCGYDVVVLTETWLHDGIKTEELFSDMFTVWRRDRDYSSTGQSRGGGVLIAVKRELSAHARPEWHSTAEDIWVTINFTGNKKNLPLTLHLGCVYLCEQNRGLSFSSQLANFCDKVLAVSTQNPSDKLVIMGDFNLSAISWLSHADHTYLMPACNSNDSDQSELVDMLYLNNLGQYNHVLNGLSRILDLVLCSDEMSVAHCQDPLVEEDKAHHQALLCTPLFVHTSALVPRPRPVYSYSKGDYVAFRAELDTYDWNTLLRDGTVDEAVALNCI